MAKLSAFHNQTTAELADEYGNVDGQIKVLTERKEALREELLARVDDAPAVGERWTIYRSDSVSTRIDTKKVRALLGDDCSKVESVSKTTRLTPKPTLIFGAQAAE
jgi:hypothetical protein